MNQTRFAWVTTLLLLVALFSCDPDSKETVDPQNDYSGLRAGAMSGACRTFQYADTIFYPREQATDYVVAPVTAQAGTYGAYPGGMIINAATGAINVTKSDHGLKYRVWFVKAGTSDTCNRYVTLSGVNYVSKLYNISSTDTLAKPFYNAIRNLAPPCSDGGADDDDDDDDDEEDDDGCEFDDGDDDDDGDGSGDEPPTGQQVTPLGVDIDKQVGIINLRRTVTNGTFGATPVNGTSKAIRIYYRLNDASNRTLNHIDVTLHYYTSASHVPAWLRAQVDQKWGATLRRAASTTPPILNGPVMDVQRPRPPDIVIVGY